MQQQEDLEAGKLRIGSRATKYQNEINTKVRCNKQVVGQSVVSLDKICVLLATRDEVTCTPVLPMPMATSVVTQVLVPTLVPAPAMISAPTQDESQNASAAQTNTTPIPPVSPPASTGASDKPADSRDVPNIMSMSGTQTSASA